MNKKLIPILLIPILLMGCSKSIYDIGEKINLVGDYKDSEPEQYIEDSPDYLLTNQIICDESGKCVVIMEIDYELFAKELEQEMKPCGIDFSSQNELTEDQIDCANKVYTTLGIR